MDQYLKNLVGNSMHLMETDDEDDIENPEEIADITDIVDHLNKPDFKFIYYNLYNEIMFLDFDRKRELCQKLELKFSEIYDFEFTPKLTFDSDDDLNLFLKFIEFIEFDYIDFIAKIITGLDFDLLRKSIDQFLNNNFENIYEKINKQLKNEIDFKLISIFFRTNNKEGIREFISSVLSKDKMLIILKSMEGEFQNE
jgi:hypothetical protein